MKKILLTVAFLAIASPVILAQKYMTRTGKISFNVTAPNSPERVEAVNNEVACIVDAKSGDIVFQVLIKSFRFERALMQEHFNENYMESDKFPKSDFKGTITNLGEINFTKDGTYNAKVSGKLTIHGITKDVSVPGTITVSGSKIQAKAKFSVALKDYNINIPSLVADKVGKNAAVTIETELTQK
jgi:hypothetical protein